MRHLERLIVGGMVFGAVGGIVVLALVVPQFVIALFLVAGAYVVGALLTDDSPGEFDG